MRYLLIIVFLISTFNLNAQTTFVVDDFSDKYVGKVFIADTKEVFSPGWVAIFDKKTKKQLIKTTSDELTYNLHGGNIVSNINELPYGEQSSIMYEDFNFDGKKDLALMDGQNSCYHGPSFQVYLAAGNGFKRSSAFTRLAQEYCGMFDIDDKKKQISTMTKSGCCWHQYSDFVVIGNKPVPIKIFEEGLNPNGFIWDMSESIRSKGRMHARTYSVLDVDGMKDKIFYSFEFGNKKQMSLIRQGESLTYVFTDKDNTVELIADGQFTYSQEEDSLTFSKGKTRYKVMSGRIDIDSPKISRQMKGEISTIRGSLTELRNTPFENVRYR